MDRILELSEKFTGADPLRVMHERAISFGSDREEGAFTKQRLTRTWSWVGHRRGTVEGSSFDRPRCRMVMVNRQLRARLCCIDMQGSLGGTVSGKVMRGIKYVPPQ